MDIKNEGRILKSIGTVGLATSASRIFGYFRDAVLALVLGAGLGMDAFTIAFRLANLFRRLVAEGAMSTAFVPVFVAYRNEHTNEELWDFARKFFYTLAAGTAAIVLLEVVFAPWVVHIMAPGFLESEEKWQLTVLLTRLMAPYLVLVALAALLGGVLNSLGHFWMPALSPVFFNVSIIVSAFLLARVSQEPAVGIAVGVLVGGGFQLVTQIPAVVRKGMSFKFGWSLSHPQIRKVGALLAPTVFGVGIVQINLLVDSLMASFLREGSVSHLYYADRIMELVLGVFVISVVTVMLPEMSRSAAERDVPALKSTLQFSLRNIAFVAIPATVGLFLLADPIIHVLFERGRFSDVDTERTAVALAFYALGLCFISGTKMMVSAFYALQDTKTPVKAAGISLVLNVVLNWILMQPLKQGGIALATSISSTVSFGYLVYWFQKKNGPIGMHEIRKSVVKILGASAVLGGSCLVLIRIFAFGTEMAFVWKAAALFGTIAGAVMAYVIACVFFKVDELRLLKGIWFRGAGRSC